MAILSKETHHETSENMVTQPDLLISFMFSLFLLRTQDFIASLFPFQKTLDFVCMKLGCWCAIPGTPWTPTSSNNMSTASVDIHSSWRLERSHPRQETHSKRGFSPFQSRFWRWLIFGNIEIDKIVESSFPKSPPFVFFGVLGDANCLVHPDQIQHEVGYLCTQEKKTIIAESKFIRMIS